MNSRAIATCDCQGSGFVQTKTVYSTEAGGELCVTCESYPVYLPPSRKNEAAESFFTGNLQEYVQDWNNVIGLFDNKKEYLKQTERLS